jgi:hypothetical protein
VSGIQDLLIRGSEKVIGHYRLLLASAKNEEERELYRSRIEREQRLLTSSMAAFRRGSQRDRTARRGPLHGVRHRAEAAWTQQVEMVRSYDRRTCR